MNCVNSIACASILNQVLLMGYLFMAGIIVGVGVSQMTDGDIGNGIAFLIAGMLWPLLVAAALVVFGASVVFNATNRGLDIIITWIKKGDAESPDPEGKE